MTSATKDLLLFISLAGIACFPAIYFAMGKIDVPRKTQATLTFYLPTLAASVAILFQLWRLS